MKNYELLLKGECIKKINAIDDIEAVMIFSKTKQLDSDSLFEIFDIAEIVYLVEDEAKHFRYLEKTVIL